MKISHSNQPPPRPRVDPAAYLPWVQAFRSHLPQLAELASFPRPLSIAARNAFLSFPTASQYAPHLGRYYAAPPHLISTYRPASMLHMFRDLYDVITYARTWCAEDDVRARKAAASARLAIKRAVTPEPISDADAAVSLQMIRDLSHSLSLPSAPADAHI